MSEAVDRERGNGMVARENYFDALALWEAVDAQRQERGWTWREFHRAFGRSAALKKRIDAYLAGDVPTATLDLVRWLGRTPESFTDAPPGTPADVLPGPGLWYMNTRELGAAVEAARLERGLTWRQVADEMGCTVAQATALKRPGRDRPEWGGMGVVYHPLDVMMSAAHWLGRSAASFMWQPPVRRQGATAAGRRRLRQGVIDVE